MRRFILPASLVLALLLFILLGAGYALAENGPIPAGAALFNLQDFAEQQRARLIQSPTGQADYQLKLLERRSEDLAGSISAPNETAALDAVDRSLNQAILALSAAPGGGLDQLKAHLAKIVVNLQATLEKMAGDPLSRTEVYKQVSARTAALHNMVASFNAGETALNPMPPQEAASDRPASAGLAQAPTGSAVAQPQAVAFPPGSPGAEHGFFPLSGKHTALTCETCHVNGVYAGTPAQCVACHEDVVPAEHYPGDCASCHLATTWKEIQFDHRATQAVNCTTCHFKTQPANHYFGQCSACHTVTAWKPATFNHLVARANNCQGCHDEETPPNHYAARCSACHNTRAWLPARFNHAAIGASNCQNCHSADRPAGHFSGGCSACHNSNGWLPASFSHSAAGASDCGKCHSDDRPANHFAGQCSSCHSTTTWSGAQFSHSGQTDCSSCHKPPGGHYSGQCSSCHSTSTWSRAKFSHSGLNDCSSCHSSDAPSGHWSGQCSACHNPGGWSDVKVSGHGFPMDHGDADGECSACHEGASSSVNCYRCHDKAATEEKHTEKDILDIGGRCLQCHPDGQED